jgi:hypothetical protein
MSDIAGNRSGCHPRPANNWLHVLDGASSEHDIVVATREFLATWTPEEIGRLPENCRPGKISDGEDIGEFAYRLSNAHLDFRGSPGDRQLLERLMGFFVHAAARFATVGAKVP